MPSTTASRARTTRTLLYTRSWLASEVIDQIPPSHVVRIIRHRNAAPAEASRLTISGKMRDVCAMLNHMTDH